MVDASGNHPSVIMWAFFNEGASDSPDSTPAYTGALERGVAAPQWWRAALLPLAQPRLLCHALPPCQAMAEAIRARDTSRLVTWASNKIEKDVNYQLADVVSFNSYPGWYGGGPADVNRYDSLLRLLSRLSG